MRDLNQELAVGFEHPDIIVAAGAGTGKTESMTNRVVRNVVKGASIRNILVLTFTNLAASEMKGRIESKLRQAAYRSPDPEEKKRLLDEAQFVDRAHIRTFHSFCVDLIREYHHHLDISPDFYVLSESEKTLMRKELFNELFQSRRKNREMFSDFYDWYVQTDQPGKPKNFEKYVNLIFDEAEKAIDFEEKLRDLNPYRKEKEPIWLEENKLMVAKRRRDAVDAIAVFDEFVSQSPVAGDSGMETSGNMLVTLDKKGKRKEIRSPKAANANTLEMLKSRFQAVLGGGDERYSMTKLVGIPDEVFAGQVIFGVEIHSLEQYKKIAKKTHDIAKALIERLKKQIEFMAIPHRELFEQAFDSLSEFVRLLKRRMDESKAERNAVDFADQEHMALALLEMEEVRRSVQGKFSHMFVDENQDSSDIQARIVQLVSTDSLYRVGDVKQCIYAFRNANPKIFQRDIVNDSLYFDTYASRKPTEEELREAKRVVIPLNTNFRTIQPILDFVNLIFRNEMSELYRSADLISYRTIEARMKKEAEARSAASDGATDNNRSESSSNLGDASDSSSRMVMHENSPVRILRYQPDPDEIAEIAKSEGLIPEELLKVDNLEIEAEITAREILRMKAEKGCKFRDFAVLIRKLDKRGAPFRRAFRRNGIPFEMQSEGNLLDSYEIMTLSSAIRAILNPYRDTDFVILLRSPFFEFTFEEIYLLSRKVKSKSLAYYSLFSMIVRSVSALSPENQTENQFENQAENQAEIQVEDRAEDHSDAAVSTRVGESESDPDLKSDSNPDLKSDSQSGSKYEEILFDDLPAELIQKVLYTYEKVNWLRGYSHYLTPAEWLWKLNDFNAFFDKIGRLPDGASRQKNLKIYINKALEENVSLDELAHREEMKLPNEISEDTDTVKMMTIHSSKGMGFPHVFLCGSDSKINYGDDKMQMISSDLGVVLKFLRRGDAELDSPLFELAKERVKRMVLEEERRVLYVAMTRAKESLTILTSESGSSYSEGEEEYEEEYEENTEKQGEGFSDVSESKFMQGDEKEVYFDIIRPYIGDYIIPYNSKEIEYMLSVPKRRHFKPVTASEENRPVMDSSAVRTEVQTSEVAYEPYFAYETLVGARTPNFAENIYALEKGTEAHKELELFDFRVLRTMSDAEIQSKKFSKRKVVDYFVKSPFARRIAEADEIYKEADFVDDMGTGKQQGIIDLFFIEKGKIILVDYKTDVYRKGDEEAVRGIVRRYKSQLQRYRRVLEKVYEQEVAEVYLYLLHGEGRLEPVSFGESAPLE